MFELRHAAPLKPVVAVVTEGDKQGGIFQWGNDELKELCQVRERSRGVVLGGVVRIGERGGERSSGGRSSGERRRRIVTGGVCGGSAVVSP